MLNHTKTVELAKARIVYFLTKAGVENGVPGKELKRSVGLPISSVFTPAVNSLIKAEVILAQTVPNGKRGRNPVYYSLTEVMA